MPTNPDPFNWRATPSELSSALKKSQRSQDNTRKNAKRVEYGSKHIPKSARKQPKKP